MKVDAAQRRIAAFEKRFGDAHVYLAYHAALPLALTPDLLYCIWGNFQRDIEQKPLGIPWIAVSDLILSSLCDEVGYELYEMDATVRQELLEKLKADSRFGETRLQQVAGLLLAYVRRDLQHPDFYYRDFAESQTWAALAYINPQDSVRRLVAAFERAYRENPADLMRLVSLTEMLYQPIPEFEKLLIFARAMGHYRRKRYAEAKGEVIQLTIKGDRVDLGNNIVISIPPELLEMIASPPENQQKIANLLKVIETTQDEDTRIKAIESLGKIGQRNPEAIASLIRVIETTQDKHTRMRAIESLGKIDFLPPLSWKLKQTLTGHSLRISSVAISPDGKTIASGSQDSTIRLWNAETGELLETLTGHSGTILYLTFSPDGQLLASSSNLEFNDSTIKLWDLNTRKLQKSLGSSLMSVRVSTMAFSRDGQYLASGHPCFTAMETAVRVWQVDTGKVKYNLKGNGWGAESIAFTSDGQKLVGGSSNVAIMIWDWRSEKRPRTFNRPDDFFGAIGSWFDSSKGFLCAIAISPDDKTIASGGSDQPIQLWNLETGKLERVLSDHEGYVNCLAFSSDGQTLASGGQDNTIKIWNYRTGELLQTLKHLERVNSLAFSPDGQTLVSGSSDRTVKIWHFAR